MSIDVSKSRERISAFLTYNSAGVLATADSNGKPHAATIYFTFDAQLNIYFVTKRETQKSHNLQANNRAAIAIFNQTEQTTVQIEGVVTEVTDPDQQEWVFNAIWEIAFKASQTGPPTTQFFAGGYVVYKLLTPELRIARFTVSMPSASGENIFEVIHTQPSL